MKKKQTKFTNPKIACPFCGSENYARYSYGMHILDKELEEKLNKGEIILGGCCISPDSPKYHCNSCNKDFGST